MESGYGVVGGLRRWEGRGGEGRGSEGGKGEGEKGREGRKARIKSWALDRL